MSNSIQGFWLGHSAFRFTSAGGKIIYVDPFLNNNPKTPDSEKNPEKADYILLTHGHGDHVGDTIDIAKRTGAVVVGIYDLIDLLITFGLPDNQVIHINKGGSVKLDDFKVTMVSANHSASFNGQYAGDPAGLMIHFDNGNTIYHAGDTSVMYDMKLYAELYKPDIALLPIGDALTMGPVEAAYAINLLNVKKVVPIHYGTWPNLTGTPKELKKLVENDVEVIVPDPGENFL